MSRPPIPPLVQAVESVPVLRTISAQWYERRFSGNCFGCFRGVYRTFAEAYSTAPKTKPHGFNTPAYAKEYCDRRSKLFSFDYPVLFWLRSLVTETTTIFDFGGHVGTHYYAYSKYIQYPPGMHWTVYDLPEMTQAGEELAREQGASNLRFTNRFENADGSNVLIAAGSIQYLESPTFAELLNRLNQKPQHLLINKVPLYDGPEFVTLQNGNVAFHPQYVFNRAEFIAALRGIGYELIDSWDVDTHPCYIPFHPEQSFPSHSGMYFKTIT
jgi:putative methyltransferase (TIGR04325 family)